MTTTTPHSSATHPPRKPLRQARLFYTIGNLLLLAGVLVLLYAGVLYAQVEYNRLAARGDNNLPVPQAVARPQSFGQGSVPAAFTAPVLAPAPAGAPATPPVDAPFVSQVQRILIPSIAVDAKVVEVGWDVLTEADGQQVAVWQVAEYAVGHHHGSANPGDGENVVLAGHVGGYGMVFRDLYYVQPGDWIIVYSGDQQYLYVVQERLVLDEENVPEAQRIANAQYIQPTGQEMLTLVTCWPLEGANIFSQRIIVRALPYTALPTDAANLPSSWGLR